MGSRVLKGGWCAWEESSWTKFGVGALESILNVRICDRLLTGRVDRNWHRVAVGWREPRGAHQLLLFWRLQKRVVYHTGNLLAIILKRDNLACCLVDVFETITSFMKPKCTSSCDKAIAVSSCDIWHVSWRFILSSIRNSIVIYKRKEILKLSAETKPQCLPVVRCYSLSA